MALTITGSRNSIYHTALLSQNAVTVHLLSQNTVTVYLKSKHLLSLCFAHGITAAQISMQSCQGSLRSADVSRNKARQNRTTWSPPHSTNLNLWPGFHISLVGSR